MASYIFDEPFAQLVRTGQKAQTIRRLHPGLPLEGDVLQIFGPGGAAKLLDPDPVCTAIQHIRFYRDVDGSIAVEVDGTWQDQGQIVALAQADGFRGVGQFLAYFRRKGLPFTGVLIKWAARPENPHTPPPARECRTCRHEGNSLEDWPCRTSMSAAGLTCWEPKEASDGL